MISIIASACAVAFVAGCLVGMFIANPEGMLDLCWNRRKVCLHFTSAVEVLPLKTSPLGPYVTHSGRVIRLLPHGDVENREDVTCWHPHGEWPIEEMEEFRRKGGAS